MAARRGEAYVPDEAGTAGPEPSTESPMPTLTLSKPVAGLCALAAAAAAFAAGEPAPTPSGEQRSSHHLVAQLDPRVDRDLQIQVQPAPGATTNNNQAADATITAMVHAELAKDSTLSAMRIDVDTVDGRVLLRGVAPDAAARDRATRAAQGVQGVKSVENQLSVANRS
jgi:hypothetical protein